MYSRSNTARRAIRIAHGEPATGAFPKKSVENFLSGVFGRLWQRRLAGWDRAAHAKDSAPENGQHSTNGHSGFSPG